MKCFSSSFTIPNPATLSHFEINEEHDRPGKTFISFPDQADKSESLRFVFQRETALLS